MNANEWLELAELITARWPNADLPPETIQQWGEDLQHYPAAEVRAAIDVHYAEGNEWPPNAGQVLALMNRGSGEIDAGEAWQLANAAAMKFGFHREHQPQAALDWLEERSPAVAEAVRRFGLDEFALRDLENAGTDRAQFRDIYNAVVREHAHDQQARRIAGARRGELRPAGEAFKQIAERGG